MISMIQTRVVVLPNGSVGGVAVLLRWTNDLANKDMVMYSEDSRTSLDLVARIGGNDD